MHAASPTRADGVRVSAVTVVPWHVYLTMFVFAATVGLLAAFELHHR